MSWRELKEGDYPPADTMVLVGKYWPEIKVWGWTYFQSSAYWWSVRGNWDTRWTHWAPVPDWINNGPSPQSPRGNHGKV